MATVSDLETFKRYEQEAKNWLSSTAPSDSVWWQLILADETDRRLLFMHGNDGITFSVICPPPEGSQHFTVISDNKRVERSIRNIDGNNIQEYLAKITSNLESIVNTCSDGNIDDFEESDNEESDNEESDNEDYYYGTEEEEPQDTTSQPHHSSAKTDDDHQVEAEDINMQRFSGLGSRSAVQCLFKDLKNFKRSNGGFGVQGSPRDDNLFLWDVQLTGFDSQSQLSRDLNSYANRYNQKPELCLEMTFPDAYPMAPPFIRVIRPRFKVLTGHVTIGGSICMELLTTSGWLPSYDIESILVQVRSAIMSDPNARLDPLYANKEYSLPEAKTSFQRMVERHQW